MLSLIASLASSGMAIHQGTQGSPEQPKSLRSLSRSEKRLFKKASELSLEDYGKARKGMLDVQGKQSVGAIKSQLSNMGRLDKLATLRALSNPDTMVGALSVFATRNTSAGKVVSNDQIVQAKKSAQAGNMQSASEGVKASDAIRRGYQLQSAQNSYTDQINSLNRQNLIGQGIGSAFSSLARYKAEQIKNQTDAQQNTGQQATGQYNSYTNNAANSNPLPTSPSSQNSSK